MKAPILIIKRLPALGMALFPFILLREKAYRFNAELLNHEKIHLRQQLELLILPFYLIYLFNYLINLLKYKNHNLAYRNILFEIEAYKHDQDLDYLKKRNGYAWLKNNRS